MPNFFYINRKFDSLIIISLKIILGHNMQRVCEYSFRRGTGPNFQLAIEATVSEGKVGMSESVFIYGRWNQRRTVKLVLLSCDSDMEQST